MNTCKKYFLLDTTNSSPAANPSLSENISLGFCENLWLNSPVRPNSIVQGDCLEVLAHIPGEAVHATICSPPYDALRRYADDWSVDYHVLGKQLFRVTQPGGIAVVVIGDSTKDFAKSLTTARLTLDWVDNAGWRLFEQCIYQRAGNPGAWWSRRFRVDHESILIFFKGARLRTFNKAPLMIASKHAGKIFGGTDRQTDGSTKAIIPKAVNPMKCRGTIWSYATSNSEGNKAKLQHPATFPDKLARDLISCFSQAGDIVLDPFAGSGTTCVEAAKAGRSYIGIEIAGRYCEIASKRLLVEAGVSQAISGSPSNIFAGQSAAAA